MAAVTGGSAEVKLDTGGNPVDPAQMARFSTFAKALSCESAAVRTDLKSFASVAGLPIAAVLTSGVTGRSTNAGAAGASPGNATSNLGEIAPEYSPGGCALASALLGAATADVVLEPENPFAWLALSAALRDYEDKCSN